MPNSNSTKSEGSTSAKEKNSNAANTKAKNKNTSSKTRSTSRKSQNTAAKEKSNHSVPEVNTASADCTAADTSAAVSGITMVPEDHEDQSLYDSLNQYRSLVPVSESDFAKTMQKALAVQDAVSKIHSGDCNEVLSGISELAALVSDQNIGEEIRYGVDTIRMYIAGAKERADSEKIAERMEKSISDAANAGIESILMSAAPDSVKDGSVNSDPNTSEPADAVTDSDSKTAKPAGSKRRGKKNTAADTVSGNPHKPGDIIELGTYPQKEIMRTNWLGKLKPTGEFASAPIEWLVLKEESDRVLLLSRYGLFTDIYNPSTDAITWEYCMLRKLLNHEFLENSFTAAEKEKILDTENQNNPNPEFSTPGGNPTIDKIFLLSMDEAKTYLSSQEKRKCIATEYAQKQGAANNCFWWLRTPGKTKKRAACVNTTGKFGTYGKVSTEKDAAVRPAMWISIGK